MIKTKRIYKRNKRGQFVRVYPWDGLITPAFIKATKTIAFKFIALLLIVGLNGVAISRIGYTAAFYNDTESSAGNVFNAGMLDFVLSESNLKSFIGPEAVGEKTIVTVAMPVDRSMNMQYALSASSSLSFSPLCNALVVEAKQNGITRYNGSFSGLLAPTTTDFGTWEFRFDLPPLTSAAHGEICEADARFYAWRAEITEPENSGFDDEELFSFSFTARMVVLNEIFVSPIAGATAPKDREYIELYNNGNTSIDIEGWKIGEIQGSSEVKHIISSSNTCEEGSKVGFARPYNGASTVINTGGILVVELCADGRLGNSGDTVRLYNAATILLDGHTYPSTASGKAHVRFPDGIGFWVDPEPTPGDKNTVSVQDLILTGFDEATIREIMEMVALTGAPIPFDKPEQLLEASVDEVIIEVATSTEIVLEEATSTAEIIIEEAVSADAVIEEEVVIKEESTPEAEPVEPVVEADSTSSPQEETPVVIEETPVIVEESVPIEPTSSE